jgi:hypothetical protein
MALRTNGDYSYGDAQEDLWTELRDYSIANKYPAVHFADARCICGGTQFKLFLDEAAGVAVRVCPHCRDEHVIGDGADYLPDADLEECECPCGRAVFEVTIGVSLYARSEDVRWLYVGCRCISCGLTACYGDWKNEFIGYQALLAKV